MATTTTTTETTSIPTITQRYEPHIAGQDYQPRNISTTLNYHKDNPDGSPPAPSYSNRPESYERLTTPLDVTVHDIRGSENKYSLDTTGFQIVHHESAEKDFLDEEQIKRVYYPEVEQLLKETTGAHKVFIFDHTIRRATSDRTPTQSGEAAPATTKPLRGPVQRVHIDQSYAAGRSRVPHHLPDEAETLLAGRYQIINTWRPIRKILKNPLGVAEASSVPDEDLVPIKLIYPNREGETYAVRPNKAHRWHYLNEQTPEEVLLIKCFDSEEDGRARRVPHSAFVDPEREGEAPRESIEVRALVFSTK